MDKCRLQTSSVKEEQKRDDHSILKKCRCFENAVQKFDGFHIIY